MIKETYILFIVSLIFLFGCTKTDESLISHVEIGQILSNDQYTFLEKYENLNLKISSTGVIKGIAYKSKPHFIETTEEFSWVDEIPFPSNFQYPRIVYQNKDTLIISRANNYQIYLYRSTGGSDFIELFQHNLNDDNAGNIAMKDGNHGYFFTTKSTNNAIFYDKFYKIEGSQVSLITTEQPGRPVSHQSSRYLHVFPSGKLFIAAYNYDTENCIYSESFDGGKTWTMDTVDFNNRHGIEVTISDNFHLSSHIPSNKIFRSNDGINWTEISPSGINDLLDYHFINENEGYLISKVDRDSYGYIVDVLKTSDGGNNWTKINNDQIYGNKIYFANSKLGIAYSNYVFQVTYDGGRNWELKALKRSF